MIFTIATLWLYANHREQEYQGRFLMLGAAAALLASGVQPLVGKDTTWAAPSPLGSLIFAVTNVETNLRRRDKEASNRKQRDRRGMSRPKKDSRNEERDAGGVNGCNPSEPDTSGHLPSGPYFDSDSIFTEQRKEVQSSRVEV
ncbi:MAG: hypothetical protein L6R36_008035 [Xanthoria steineri]|nr:MAG: hypothetical protein L6R36_008035 [Xanthoria steineri]